MFSGTSCYNVLFPTSAAIDLRESEETHTSKSIMGWVQNLTALNVPSKDRELNMDCEEERGRDQCGVESEDVIFGDV